MGKVYASQQLNAAVDTSDLVPECFHAETQYKHTDYDPDYEAKELAKIKRYAEVSV